MGLFKNIYADLRKAIGLEPTIEILERKISNTNKESERFLKKQKFDNQVVIERINYNTQNPKNDLEMLNNILANIENIKEKALKDILMYSSGMESRVGSATGNYQKLCTWLEFTKKNINIQLYINYKHQIEETKEILTARYIDAVLSGGLQDNNEIAENEEIIHLFQILQMDANEMEIFSPRSGYSYIEDIKNQAERKSRMLISNIHRDELEKRPYEQENARIQYQLNAIENQRNALRNTKAYIEAQRQNERMKRG